MPIYVGDKQVTLPGISKVFVGDKMVYNPDGKYTVRCNIAEAADYYEIASGSKRYVMWYVNEKLAPADAYGACIFSTPSGSTNGGTYYETDETWRIYDSTDGSYGLDIACSSGYIITKIGIQVGRSSCYIRDPRGYVINPTSSSGMLYFPVYNHFGNQVHLRIAGNSAFANAGNAYINNIYVEYEKGYAETNKLDNIELINPGPTQFIQGYAFYYSGTVRAWYTRNFYQDVTASCTFTGYNMAQLGEQDVTVSYTEGGITKTAGYDITVIANALDYIEVYGATTTFQNGGTFVFDGDVYAYYLDGGYTQILSGYIVNASSVDMDTDGTYPVTVSYTEGGITKSYTYNITVTTGTPDITVTHSVADLATANSWTTGTYVGASTFYLDYDTNSRIGITGSNIGGATYATPKYYLTSGESTLRCYGSNVNNTIGWSNGQNYMLIDAHTIGSYKIKKIKITCNSSYQNYIWVRAGDGNGTFDNAVQLTNDVEYTLTTPRGFISIFRGDASGNPASGNIRITNISITYGN